MSENISFQEGDNEEVIASGDSLEAIGSTVEEATDNLINMEDVQETD